MHIVALWIGKILFVGLRLVGRRGAALPGLVVERLFPNFLISALKNLPEGVVVITGTNGKTTSTKMLTHVLRSEKRVLTNPTGSNFVRGIVASIVQHSSWSGSLPYDVGVFELDEAYAAQFVRQYKPRGVVVLNVMRDQMDRFGEIDHTAKLIEEVVQKTTEFIVLNGDDTRVSAMRKDAKADTYFFGVDQQLRDVFRTDDELHHGPIINKNHWEYSAILKGFDDKNTATIVLDNVEFKVTLAAQGAYNAQNAVAVCLASKLLGIGVEKITTRIAEVKPAFGRGESIDCDGKTIILQLVKNPGGFRHALMLGPKLKPQVTMLSINDDYPDGRDVSWLWDVNYCNKISGTVVTSGSRAEDMALRLKYDEINTTHVEPDLHYALDAVLALDKKTILIYATYTAMLELRRLLAQKTEVEKI